MKRFVTLATFLMIGHFAMSQIDSFTIESSKTYDDGTKIMYLNLDGNISMEIRSLFERELKHTSDVKMFRYYNNQAPEKCMLKVAVNFTDEDLQQVIDDVNASYSPKLEEAKAFSEKNDAEYYKYPLLNDLSEMDQKAIKTEILKKQFVVNFSFGNQECKIGVKQGTSESEIIQTLESVGLHIE